jgi:hypothetical protein
MPKTVPAEKRRADVGISGDKISESATVNSVRLVVDQIASLRMEDAGMWYWI